MTLVTLVHLALAHQLHGNGHPTLLTSRDQEETQDRKVFFIFSANGHTSILRYPGEKGTAGLQGSIGPDGMTGSPGYAGLKGMTGEQG